MTRPRPLPSELDRPFFVGDAYALGVTEPRLRRGDLIAPYRGSRVSSDRNLDLPTRCAAALAAVGAGACISHVTAARLWGLPLPLRHENDPIIDVTVAAPRRATRLAGVRGHRLTLAKDQLRVLDRIVVTSPARTWCDLARVLSEEDLVAAGDRIVWHRDPLAPWEELAAAVRAHPPGQGGGKLMRAYPLLDERSEARPESIIRTRIIKAGLPRPEANFVVRSASGAFLARVDLAFVDYRMALEYEGDHHRTDRKQWHSDLRRVPRLEDEQWHTTRMGPPDLVDSRELIERIARRLRERGWRP